MNKGMNDWMNKGMNDWMNEWMNKLIEWMNWLMIKCAEKIQ